MALQEERLKAGFSQKTLADASGVKKRLIQVYEIGQRDVNQASLDTLCKLAIAMGCKISDIITDEEVIEMLKKCT